MEQPEQDVMKVRGNVVSLKGNITRDAEVRRVGDSNVIAWGVAWNSRKRDRNTGEYVDVPHYFDVECWASDKQLAMLDGQIVKGARCAIVDGHLEYQSWSDQQGNKRSKVVIKVDDPIGGLMLAPKQGGQQGGYQQQQYQPQQQQPQYVEASVYDDDIPW